MTNQDFLNFLKEFPGKEDLKRGAPRYIEFANIDFGAVVKKIRESNLQIEIDKNEDLWIRFLTFADIANFYISAEKTIAPIIIPGENFLSEASIRLSYVIVDQINFYFKKDRIYAVTAIPMNFLVKFFKDGNCFVFD